MNETTLISIGIGSVIISLCMFLLAFSYNLVQEIKVKTRELDLKEYEINIESNIAEENFTLLDAIIQESFQEYTILNIEYKDIEYIPPDLEKTITQDVAHKVIERISPAMMAKLSLLYNTKNFVDLLSQRVYLHTLEYAIKKNSLKKE